MFPTQYLIPKVYIKVNIYQESCITQQFESVNLEGALLKIIGQLPGPAIAVLDNCVNQTWYYFETLEADL